MPPHYPTVQLLPGKEKPLKRRHPWVFSGAFPKGGPKGLDPGQLIDLTDAAGNFLARGYYNFQSQIRFRALSFDRNEDIDAAFWRRRIAAAWERRASGWRQGYQTGFRVIMSEADRLPGLIVDRYGDVLVMQLLTAGLDRQRAAVIAALQEVLSPRLIVERSDDAVRELEGLPSVAGVVYEAEGGVGRKVSLQENGLTFRVDLETGHKTGYYFDQRTNHALVAAHAAGKRVLDCFSYTGGFTVHAAKAGAKSILAVDASAPALALLQENLAANGLSDIPVTTRTGNAFDILRALRDEEATYDLIILDPPKFAANGAQVDKAARAYKDINLLAFKMLAPGGILATFSCSGHISADLFQKIIFGAAHDAGVDAQIIATMSQADDHPVLLSFPESFYLKGLLLRLVEA